MTADNKFKVGDSVIIKGLLNNDGNDVTGDSRTFKHVEAKTVSKIIRAYNKNDRSFPYRLNIVNDVKDFREEELILSNNWRGILQ